MALAKDGALPSEVLRACVRKVFVYQRRKARALGSVYSGGQIRELVSGPTLVDLYLGYRFHFGCAVDGLDLYLTGYDVLATGAAGVPHGAMVGARLGF